MIFSSLAALQIYSAALYIVLVYQRSTQGPFVTQCYVVLSFCVCFPWGHFSSFRFEVRADPVSVVATQSSLSHTIFHATFIYSYWGFESVYFIFLFPHFVSLHIILKSTQMWDMISQNCAINEESV
jgi:hypothetical protein